MANCAIVGINWGDEGKGRMVDYLTDHFDVVVRYQGGGNAGHTVVNDKGKFALHLLPSGIFREGVVNILGNGVALDCENLYNEIETLRAAGVAITPENLKVSERASLLLPWHRELDALEEARLKDKKYGSTKQGIAPFYSDKYQKKTVLAGEPVSYTHLRSPFPVRLNPAMMGAFETLAPYITAEPLKTLTRDVRANADAIAAYCYQSPALFPFVTTTIAPTVIQGSSKACNVMPQDMQAVINFRLADGDTVESVMAHCRAAVQDPTVELRYQQANDPSATARRDGYGYRTVVDSMQRYYPDVVFVPSMTVGATDAHQYEQICDTCLRCSPFMAEPEEAASGVHGTNERILVRAYLQGIRVLIDLMEHANL